jgi:ATP-dependent DNA ligase
MARRASGISRTSQQPGRDLYDEACRLELEGVVAKEADAPHVGGHDCNWIKVKTPAGRERERERFDR